MTDATDPAFSGFSDDQELDPDQPEETNPFEPVAVRALPPALADDTPARLASLGTRMGVRLDLPSFQPTHGAHRAWNGYAMGEPVIGFVTWRAVGEIRLGGIPGLLVAEVTLTDDAPVDEAMVDAPIDVHFVAFARTADAERVALVRTPGFPLRLGAPEVTR